MRVILRGMAWVGLFIWVSACAPKKTSMLIIPTERPKMTAMKMMEMCWPSESKPTSRVRLSFQRENGKLQNIFFEAIEGASVSTARCARQVAYAFPWNAGEVPERLELAPPPQPPSGWVALAYFRLLISAGLSEPALASDAASLISACLQQPSTGGALSKFRLKTQPNRVSPLRFDGQRWTELAEPSDTERCIVAVLASSRYPNGEWILDFNQDAEFKPESRGNVSMYFPKKDTTPQPTNALDPVAVSEGMQSVRAQVEACWNDALQRRWGLSGGRSVRFWGSKTGEMEHVQFINNTSDATNEASDFLLDECLTRALMKSRFPAPAASTFEGTYSWVFSPR